MRQGVTGVDRSPQPSRYSNSSHHITQQYQQVCLGDKIPSRGHCLGVQGKLPTKSAGGGVPGTGPSGKGLDHWPHMLGAMRQQCWEAKDTREGLGCDNMTAILIMLGK